MENKYDISREVIRDLLTENSKNPVAEEAVLQAETDLLGFAEEHALDPAPGLREKVLDKIRLLNAQKNQRQKLNLHDLPLLDESANWLDWKEVIAGIAPPDDYEDIHMHTLVVDDTRELFVAWVKEFVPEEVHHDLLESFLILEGSCKCFITSPDGNTRTIRLGEGDFYTMQPGDHHDLQITSAQPAKAIIQWKKLAA